MRYNDVLDALTLSMHNPLAPWEEHSFTLSGLLIASGAITILAATLDSVWFIPTPFAIAYWQLAAGSLVVVALGIVKSIRTRAIATTPK
jgi:hypothetical protein